MFFLSHDATSSGQKGDEVGSQYRSMLLCSTEAQLQAARLEVEHQRQWRSGSNQKTLHADENQRPILTEVAILMSDESHQPLSAAGAHSAPSSSNVIAAGDSTLLGPEHYSQIVANGDGNISNASSQMSSRAFRFFPAEERHQQYFEKNSSTSSFCSLVIVPKLDVLARDANVHQLLVLDD